MTATTPELALRSLRPDWDRARWEQLPDDGNRYEIIDGVLYMTTAPSVFHQRIIRPAERDALVFSQPDMVLGIYTRVDTIAPDGDLASLTLPFRATIADFFAGAPDTTL